MRNAYRALSSSSRSGDSFLNRSGHGDKSIDLCEFKKLENVGAHSDGNDANTPGAGADEMTDDEAETRGIESGNLSDVEDVKKRTLFAGRGFEFEDVDDSERFEDGIHIVGRKSSGELKDEHASQFIFDAFDGELLTLP